MGTRAVSGHGRLNHEGAFSAAALGPTRDRRCQSPRMFGKLNIVARPTFDELDEAFVVDQKLIVARSELKASPALGADARRPAYGPTLFPHIGRLKPFCSFLRLPRGRTLRIAVAPWPAVREPPHLAHPAARRYATLLISPAPRPATKIADATICGTSARDMLLALSSPPCSGCAGQCLPPHG